VNGHEKGHHLDALFRLVLFTMPNKYRSNEDSYIFVLFILGNYYIGLLQ